PVEGALAGGDAGGDLAQEPERLTQAVEGVGIVGGVEGRLEGVAGLGPAGGGQRGAPARERVAGARGIRGAGHRDGPPTPARGRSTPSGTTPGGVRRRRPERAEREGFEPSNQVDPS